jgi:hypothetical protein
MFGRKLLANEESGEAVMSTETHELLVRAEIAILTTRLLIAELVRASAANKRIAANYS